MDKSTTRRIQIFEPDEEQLAQALVGRKLCPVLLDFLKKTLKTKKWARKINIPSGYEDLAAVLVFTTELKEAGLEIFSELHVFYAGKVMVEKWQVVGDAERMSHLPKETFQAINIDKVRAQGSQVNVEFSVPTVDGHSEPLLKTFEFGSEGPSVQVVPHPLVELESNGAEDVA